MDKPGVAHVTGRGQQGEAKRREGAEEGKGGENASREEMDDRSTIDRCVRGISDEG